MNRLGEVKTTDRLGKPVSVNPLLVLFFSWVMLTVTNTEYHQPYPPLLLCLPGSGHVVHPVHRVCAARDPSEAPEEPEHSSQLQATVPSFRPAGPAQLLPALQTARHSW